MSQDTITIRELAVSYHVGVTDAERAQPQKLLLTLELGHDFGAAAEFDDLNHTIDYYAVCQRLLRFGEGRAWKLIETLAVDIASMVRTEFHAASVTVEVKKFIIPETRYVSVRIAR
jgi:dihydroneopterin aldolase